MTASPAIELKSVWKVFGQRAGEALAAIRSEQIGKDEVLQRFGCVVAVADVSIAIAQGEIFCIMGLSGSGKSTLLRHVNRLVEPTAGEVRIHGEDISSKSGRELRELRAKRIGMVFQHVALFPHRRIWENVAFGLEVRGLRNRSENRSHRRHSSSSAVRVRSAPGNYPAECSTVGLAEHLRPTWMLLMDEPFSASICPPLNCRTSFNWPQ